MKDVLSLPSFALRKDCERSNISETGKLKKRGMESRKKDDLKLTVHSLLSDFTTHPPDPQRIPPGSEKYLVKGCSSLNRDCPAIYQFFPQHVRDCSPE